MAIAHPPRRRRARLRRALPLLAAALLAGCAAAPPREQSDLCAVFDQYPEWYDYAQASYRRWGTPPHILMSFVKQESAYRARARPPRKRFLGIPLWRASSARGYAQIQDPAWSDYLRHTGSGLTKSRSDMEDALDFIGWYNDQSHRRLGISKWDPRNLYLAYHEGHGGYARGRWKGKRWLLRVASRVDRQAREYGAQLERCEHRFRCRKWYQIGPLCS